MSYPATRTFWLEPTDTVLVGLRRYHRNTGDGWTCAAGYHDALVFTGREPARYLDHTDTGRRTLAGRRAHTPPEDPRWPKACRCGYEFVHDDAWQDWQDPIWRRTDTGAEVTLRQHDDRTEGQLPSAPPGGSWDAWWMPAGWRGPDGIALMVRLPNGHDWHVDGRASNCTRPEDRVHKCWVRTGDPRTGTVTAGKDGDTCAAGAGSILAGDYHGFLRDGVLTAG